MQYPVQVVHGLNCRHGISTFQGIEPVEVEQVDIVHEKFEGVSEVTLNVDLAAFWSNGQLIAQEHHCRNTGFIVVPEDKCCVEIFAEKLFVFSFNYFERRFYAFA
ncbi:MULTISPECIES: hypothetical protein [unclassified Maridesulfovibrio]|uniref:hypothetical protein n=1 Tax=unclassified Maridesulfovibrio TaxID=2794999 RepID=UPI003B40D01F